MVYSTLTDRIGNLLFQIGAGASLAARNNSEFKCCIIERLVPEGITLVEYIEQYRDNILRNVVMEPGIPIDSIEFAQPGFNFSPLPYYDNIRLSGYFQSEKFLDREIVLKLFSIDDKSKEHIERNYGALFSEEIISINVRRGDYLKRPLRQPICEMPYFRRALKYFGPKRRYLVISDDIEWCRKMFRGDNFIFIDDEPPVIDLYLQTYCTHNIISNSTFSWWGAWLNPNPEKIVVAPKKWFGIQMKNLDTSDLIPESWVRIPNPRTLSLTLKIILNYLFDLFNRGVRKFMKTLNLPL